VITTKEYLMGRDKEFPLSIEQAINMADLLIRVNLVLLILKIEAIVTSGYRPGKYNKKAGGATLSGHLMCCAVDIADPLGKLAPIFLANVKLLEEYGLYLEDPSYTKGWIHLDTKPRKNRVFIPYIKANN
jgi:uncharacterized protein YcbK (DUF882 family)